MADFYLGLMCGAPIVIFGAILMAPDDHGGKNE